MSKTILIADDDDQLRKAIATALKAAGHTIHTACDGEEAIDIASKNKTLEVVVTDIMMPKANGIEVIKKLKAINSKLRIIVMSGGGKVKADHYLKASQWLGADCIMEKPFSPQDMLEAIEES